MREERAEALMATSGELLSEHRVFREVGSLDVATHLAWRRRAGFPRR